MDQPEHSTGRFDLLHARFGTRLYTDISVRAGQARKPYNPEHYAKGASEQEGRIGRPVRRSGRFDLPDELAPMVQPTLVVPVPRDIPTEGGTSRWGPHSSTKGSTRAHPLRMRACPCPCV